MLTPSFELTQNDEYLQLYINAPYAKISETEIYIQDYDVTFYSKPYYLRLKLPGRVIENGNESANYDSDKGSFTIKIPKLNPGETFEGLSLLTKLLAPSRHTVGRPTIEFLDDEKHILEQDEFSWEIEQVPCEEESEISLLPAIKYGFANNYSSKLNKVKEEIIDCIDLNNPDNKTVIQRQREKFEAEMEQFSDDHYLADLFQDEAIQELLKYEAEWESHCKKLSQDIDKHETHFTEEEKRKLVQFPNKKYILDKKMKHTLFLGLVDILLAFAYNVRTTEGENTVESPWTICKLSGTLSWLVTFSSLKEVVVSFMRRSLCYPLYRHWSLSTKVIEDVQRILSLGPEYVLKCLLEIHSIVQGSDSRYILNELYISDYCIWIQTSSPQVLLSLSKGLSQIKINKEHAKLDLIELEAAAVLALKEDSSKHCLNAAQKNSITSTFNSAVEATVSQTESAPLGQNGDDGANMTEIIKDMEKLILTSSCSEDVKFSGNKLPNSDHSSSNCITSTASETESSDSESTSSGSSSLTDSDDYSSTESDSEEDSDDDDTLDERHHLLAKQRG